MACRSSGRSRPTLKLQHLPVMMVSNYPEHQQLALQAGAEPGFGKLALQESRDARAVARDSRWHAFRNGDLCTVTLRRLPSPSARSAATFPPWKAPRLLLRLFLLTEIVECHPPEGLIEHAPEELHADVRNGLGACRTPGSLLRWGFRCSFRWSAGLLRSLDLCPQFFSIYDFSRHYPSAVGPVGTRVSPQEKLSSLNMIAELATNDYRATSEACLSTVVTPR